MFFVCLFVFDVSSSGFLVVLLFSLILFLPVFECFVLVFFWLLALSVWSKATYN